MQLALMNIEGSLYIIIIDKSFLPFTSLAAAAAAVARRRRRRRRWCCCYCFPRQQFHLPS